MPLLTVVVLVGNLRERAVPCLRSLLDQDLEGEMEILVFDLGAEEAPPVPLAGEGRVRVLRARPGVAFAEVRAAAVAEARSEVVAYVEEHVRVLPGWARALVDAHAEPGVAAVGATVEAGNPERGRSSAIGAMSYGLWYPPAERGDVGMLPGHNCSYKRRVLRDLGDDLPRLLQCDIQLQKRLHREGHRLVLEPAAGIEHLNEGSWGSIARGVYLWHRCYGPLRAWDEGWSLARRALYVLAAPLMPAYFLGHYPRRLGRFRPDLASLIRRHAIPIYGVQLAAAWGQALGLLVGPGRAPEQFTEYELHEPRPV